MAGDGRSLKDTSTWAVAVVCFVMVLISIVIEHLIHLTGSWLRKRNKRSLYEALEKIKEELMLLGFISLLLAVTQDRIVDICIPESVGNSWHPCDSDKDSDKDYKDKCREKGKGKVEFVSLNGIHELHIFIFVLAVFHVVFCILTLGLGTLKMKKWKAWEDETKTLEYQSLHAHDPERLRYARDTSFGRRHLDFWSHSPVLLWIVCFFRQFFPSVAKVDYLALRHGFINAHLTPQSQMKFDFWSYINRSLEADFKVVVGISPILWLFAVLFLLTNTHGWYSHLWLPFIPLIILLVVGAKLQVTITRMGLRIQERGEVIQGTPVVETGDYLFWFNNPRFILFLIHFVLFANAFQLAFFSWSLIKGLRSCFYRQRADIIIRLSMGVIIQVLCSYVTLPLYALVTQMGSTMRPTIFNNQVASTLDNWHRNAKKHAKNGRKSETAMSTSQPGTPLHGMSPVHLLNGYRSSTAIGHSLPSSPRKSDGLMIGAWDTEIELSRSPTRHHDYGGDFRMSRWNDQVGDEIGELGATQRVDLESRAAVDGGQREVRIGSSISRST